MNKPISPLLHGVLDYATVLATAALPAALRFSPRAAALSRGLSAGYLALSSVTDYPLSLTRRVPFPTHGRLERLSGFALPLLPLLAGFAQHRAARNFFLALAGVTFVVYALTDWESANPC